ncbi:MAG: hypothetical protein JWM57_2417, partial [Phycisphaerales bacterium]|nr:hypothetical protein [Phycisphaerales bacterium]
AAAAAAAGPFGQPLMRKDEQSLGSELVWRGTYADLRDPVVRHPDWPNPGNVHDVWFLPADAIDSVTISLWYGAKIRMADAEFNLHVSPFTYRTIRDQLRQMGWLDRAG